VPAVAAVGYAALTEVSRGGGRRADVRFVLVDVDFELVRLEQDALGVDALEVESDFLRLDAEFGQDVREVVVDDLALFEDLRVLGDHDRAVLNARGGPDSLELADERSRSTPVSPSGMTTSLGATSPALIGGGVFEASSCLKRPNGLSFVPMSAT